MKRTLQRQGQIGPDGTPLASSRPPAQARTVASRGGPRFVPVQWWKATTAELRKVSWPSRADVVNYSLVVLLTLVVLIALIFCLDYAFTWLATQLFK